MNTKRFMGIVEDCCSEHEEEQTTMTTQPVRGGHWVLAILGISAVLILAAVFGVALAQEPRTAMITFTAPTTRTDGSTITGALSYDVWQGLKGQTKAKVATITGTATTIDTGLQGGTEYCWAIVAVEAGNPNPSAMSSDGCKAFDMSAPNVVTITVT